MKTTKGFRLDAQTLARLQKITEHENISATTAVTKAINLYAVISNLDCDGRSEEEIKSAAYFAYLAM